MPEWKKHTGFVAVPTLLLAIAVGVGHVGIWLAVAGGLPLWVGLVVNTVLAYAAFTPIHEAVHGNVGGGRAWLDRLVGWTLSPMLLGAFPTFKLIHLRHHGHTNHPEKDPDFWVAGSNPLSIVLRCWTLLPHYYLQILGPLRSERATQKVLGQTLAMVVLMALAGAALTAVGLGTEVVALWLVPAWLASGVLALVFDWLPHVPHAARGRYVDTRAIVLPGLEWLTFWQSLHLVHHLYPRVVFYRYGVVFRAIREEAEAKGAPIVDVPEWLAGREQPV
ncbi:MAG: fatty acid desaturase [Proteobacteria bacterium]|nr:fatty acid desaturase [Pseudomonadota bacterium]